ncbi:hypothetical protein [Variovorax saccharolyticus]|uniref:hypothetical protein n=1 Tax=Variovorax saccharolyticus TaxID=3053516 RepID=UPI002575A2C2|nr:MULTISPECIES: hypothetical protein [unclassified Variovorax]MDM0022705.1 hypothetical protein [Variovorax sp. J22R187]MDM0030376.1 hypothetical protein [Variovorax sp. J31P216]
MPTSVKTAIVLLWATLAIDLASWLVVISRSDDWPPAAAITALVAAMGAALLWMIGKGYRSVVVLLTVVVLVAELPAVIDLLAGGIDQPLSPVDFLVQGAEAALALLACALLWTKGARRWFHATSTSAGPQLPAE